MLRPVLELHVHAIRSMTIVIVFYSSETAYFLEGTSYDSLFPVSEELPGYFKSSSREVDLSDPLASDDLEKDACKEYECDNRAGGTSWRRDRTQIAVSDGRDCADGYDSARTAAPNPDWPETNLSVWSESGLPSTLAPSSNQKSKIMCQRQYIACQ